MVRRRAARGDLPAQRPHRPQLLAFLFANGLVHTAGGVAAGAYNTGLWSAAFLVRCVVPLGPLRLRIRGPYSGKVVGVAYAAGAVTHVLLFMGYGLFKNGVIGNTGLLVFAAVVGRANHLGGPWKPVLQAELLRPVSALPASA